MSHKTTLRWPLQHGWSPRGSEPLGAALGTAGARSGAHGWVRSPEGQWVCVLRCGSCLQWLLQSPSHKAQIQGHAENSQQNWQFHLSLSRSVSPSPVTSLGHVRTGIGLVRTWEVPAPLWISAQPRTGQDPCEMLVCSLLYTASSSSKAGTEQNNPEWNMGPWKSSWIESGGNNLRYPLIFWGQRENEKQD